MSKTFSLVFAVYVPRYFYIFKGVLKMDLKSVVPFFSFLHSMSYHRHCSKSPPVGLNYNCPKNSHKLQTETN